MRNIKSIKKLPGNNPRNYCLFVLGINANLRASDLLAITAEQVPGLQAERQTLDYLYIQPEGCLYETGIIGKRFL